MQSYDVNNPYADNTLIEERKLHGARKVTARHLLASYQNKVHAGQYRYLEVEKLMAFTEKIKKGSIVDHFVRAIAITLKEKRDFNSTYDGQLHRIYKDINIGYAVNTERGLVTPVLRKVDMLTIDEFYNMRKQLIKLVQEWKQEIRDILGGTFTITNLGNFNVDLLYPIINPPQVAILGMGRICKQNITWDLKEEPVMKILLPVSLTFDHSIIDGAEAAGFLQILQDKINEPEKLWDKISL